MLNQALEIFKKEYEQNGDKLILDSYIPADGTYVIVKPTDDGFEVYETIDIKLNKETKDIDRVNEYIPFICFADYNSKLLDMNKPMDSKKIIHSNNYLSFFIKKESLVNGKLTKEIIDNYYNVLENPSSKYKKSKKASELYSMVEEKNGKVDKEVLDNIRVWIKNNIFTILENNSGKDYLKIFFDYPKENYRREGERYLIPNIYNSNDFNVILNDKTYGLPNDNMGLNSKKPYLENKTRKVTVPHLIDQEEVLFQKKFFDYLMNQAAAGKVNIYMGEKILGKKSGENLEDDFKGIYLRIKKGKEVEIHDFDIITNYKSELIKKFEYKNILGIDYDKLKGEYDKYKTLSSMQRLTNEVLFSKFLIPNYFTESKDVSINDEVIKSNLFMARTALFNWFYKGVDKNIWQLLNKVSLSLVKGSIKNGYMTKGADQFNLRISLKEYFEGGENMAYIISDIKEKLRGKISEKDTKNIESDREYFFAVGQLVSFFISRSKGKKKPLSLANPFINAKRNKIIQEKLKALYKKYNYDIESYSYRFKNLYAMIMCYEPGEKVDEDMIVAGYLHSNLLYEKDEEVKR
ncbi:type I-B CRISPR-associated protein Cas8b/Csh1 [Clostridiaceae bacterium UIB06]|uniref:Type I-B CRISPR-associated protein Cas8b/Csh1 n=1 Tax=Clostridium thailandense TaxID=2794346 RepID=A0A949X4D7_9CLOT|nr:type I-B CRISPR-associated protein Cas8b/Csh1 [Clostridium thailandense]MBV7273828.1 type I-B CRISPR-associated protein Cas8b/Csh1 [Clostridium thailandense]MCH5136907.1 type I-B CRISPR-associated protein Cas8b/Csh1 [Clostridiaceae bacterium UIB06]